MANKYPIIKHRAFFKTFTFYISTNNEDIGQKFLPDTCDINVMQIDNINRSSSRSHQGYIVYQCAAVSH